MNSFSPYDLDPTAATHDEISELKGHDTTKACVLNSETKNNEYINKMDLIL
uniref:Uncharacterized protein n=1 Tax=viral metagenome TaxID=1070528 RepID=A0A6C0EH35_9ZZZZ